MSDQEQTGSVLTGSSDAPTTDAQAPADWRSGLPEDIRNDPSLADIKDVGAMAKSYINGQKLIGKNRISLPGEGATDEEWSAFHSQLGRPEKSNLYDFGERPALPDGLEYDEGFETAYKDLAFKAGLTSQQAKAIFDGYHEYIQTKSSSEGENAAAQSAEWVNSLKKEFGKAYDERVELASRAVDTYGDGQLKEWLEQSGMGNNPMMVKLFAKIGEGIAEGRSDSAQQRGFIMTPDQAKQEIARYNRDQTFMSAYQNGDNPGHGEAVNKMNSLFKLAYPDENPIQPA
ncbi:MAG TPA: hypothetical protein DF712_20590 [Balneola sp.]|nr:hypothetical protein [Balneola sp.]|tara:strand:- start:1176 stop:2036 length:861 start_codon:yes stop_codon:yes gene_type:complete